MIWQIIPVLLLFFSLSQLIHCYFPLNLIKFFLVHQCLSLLLVSCGFGPGESFGLGTIRCPSIVHHATVSSVAPPPARQSIWRSQCDLRIPETVDDAVRRFYSLFGTRVLYEHTFSCTHPGGERQGRSERRAANSARGWRWGRPLALRAVGGGRARGHLWAPPEVLQEARVRR